MQAKMDVEVPSWKLNALKTHSNEKEFENLLNKISPFVAEKNIPLLTISNSQKMSLFS